MKTQNSIMYTVKPTQILDNALSTLYRGEYEEALHLLNTVLLFEPNNVTAQIKVALCYMYMGKLKTAKQILTQLLDEGAHDAEVLFHLAELYKINMNYDVALTFLIQAMELNENNAHYLLMATELCFLQKDYRDAYQFINRAIVINPFRKELLYWRALIFIKFDKPQIALTDLNKAIAIDEKYADAYRLRAHCKMLSNDVEGYLNDLKLAQHIDNLKHYSRLAA